MAGDLSPNFSRREFASRDGVDHPYPAVLKHLVEHLEKLRALAGGIPLVIVSGYRTPAHNALVGGAKYSRHMLGDAVDLQPYKVTRAQARSAGFTGIGIRGAWVTHVDLRPKPAEWSYGPVRRQPI